ncbi:MAG: type II CAAX prenyl endopeptidase Rce1 family protein [Actinomycetota bacterium]
MTLKRLILGILTAIAIAFAALSLLQSWNQPQIQSRLELYQTNLLLHAAEWQGDQNQNPNPNLAVVRESLTGKDVLKTALDQYQEARQTAQKTLETTFAQIKALSATDDGTAQQSEKLKTEARSSAQLLQLKATLQRVELLRDELDLRVGILQAHKQQTDAALTTWEDLIERERVQAGSKLLVETAKVLVGLWSNPAQLLPDAESQLQKNLDGWFRYRALTQLYQLQERQEALATIQRAEQVVAQQAIEKLAIVVTVPTLGFLIGLGLLIFAVLQRLAQWKRATPGDGGMIPGSSQERQSILRLKPLPSIAWDGETILQVMVVGFFLVGQILVPLALGIANAIARINPGTFDARTQALYILAQYVLLAAGGLSVLYVSLHPFLPLPEGLFRIHWRGNWFWWGLGGYLAALPLVIVVSLINQQLWQGQGGSNPILPIALESRDGVALAVFFFTASIAAPMFEEIMFRGFLLPSLTKYLPLWGAIAASGLIFAVAHLNISEVLPLATLGAVLGFVYVRSRNLLASMLLHSLWNSGTLLSLFLLGSGAS